MNPNYHFFPSPPQNPNPTPNFFFHSVSQPPPLPPTSAPILDLAVTLSSLTDLLSLSQQTLDSLSSLLSPQSKSVKPQNANLVSCPYNPHHLMPAESLFLHSLRCQSPLLEDPTSLLDSLHYPKTLALKNPSKDQNFQCMQDASAELCLSLDSYYNEFGSNFFYQDCPGVVNVNNLENDYKSFVNDYKSFVIPSVLSVECANFVGSNEGDFQGFDIDGLRILPSDFWAIRREVEGWADYPSMYSYAVFCAILRLDAIKLSDLRMWVIVSSPQYGVVIDVYMRDHISVLFSLCLKAIRREALSFLCHGMGKKTLNFGCPVQVQVLRWIVSQLSVLYGEVNAKCFVIHIFRQCVLKVANGVLFPLESNLKGMSKETSKEFDAHGHAIQELKLKEFKEGTEVDGRIDREAIFVSQVAASVAALHERSLLEAKIKRLRVCQPTPRYQRMIEHDHVSKRADEVRNKRPSYRAVIDHDGLPRKQSTNQETSKTKTRQELMAEERDYKRRRMSYRGKKLKRTTLQVMRDIIDEYMEEIKQAGGIGCFEKGAEEEEMPPRPCSSSDVIMNVDELGKSMSKSAEPTRTTPNNYQKQHYQSTTSKNASTRDFEQQEHDHHRHQVKHHGSFSRERHLRDYYYGTPERQRNDSSLHGQRNCQREQIDAELTVAKHHERRSSNKSNYQDYKSSYSASGLASNPRTQKDEKLDGRHRDTRHSYGNHYSKIRENNAFEDRYNPAESQETYEDDVYTGNK